MKALVILLLIQHFPLAFPTLQYGTFNRIPNIVQEAKSPIAEIKDTFKGIKDTFEGYSRFFNNISATLKAISSIIDPAVLLLLFFTMILSAGFSAIGMPRGKVSFFSALFTANLLWFTWRISMNPGNYSFLITMLKINSILLAPYLTILILKSIFPVIYAKLKESFPIESKFRFFQKRYKREELQYLSEKLSDSALRLGKTITADINENNKDRVRLSNNARLHLKDMVELLKKLK